MGNSSKGDYVMHIPIMIVVNYYRRQLVTLFINVSPTITDTFNSVIATTRLIAFGAHFLVVSYV
jgi:hypothetical protein